MNDLKKDALRKQIRARRASLDHDQLSVAASNLAERSEHCRPLLAAKKLLSYEPFQGEISPAKMIAALRVEELYLPLITDFEKCLMDFYPSNNADSINKFGIREPLPVGKPITPSEIDVVLVPLVAFDRQGNRVGMGAGFYDRAFAEVKQGNSKKPYLLGLAHHFQEQNSIQASPWDVPLNAILTDREFIEVRAWDTNENCKHKQNS